MRHILNSRPPCAGFTLIEMLVALSITSLVMTLLMGATFYVMQIRVKLTDEVHAGEARARQQLWFEQIVASILPVPEETPGSFEGTDLRFSSWLTQPLSAEARIAPAVAELLLQNNREISGFELVYSSAKEKMVLASWPGGSARFSYVNRKGKILSEWNARLQTVERMPRAIRIEVKSTADNSTQDFWFASIDSEPWLEKKSPPSFMFNN